MKRNKITTVIFAAMLLTACQQNPDSGIVVHKDMEKVIAEAENSDDSKADLAEIHSETGEHYQNEYTNDQLRVTVKVDADVAVPDTDKLSVLRVKQHAFTQDEVDRVRKALLGDAELIDGPASSRRTKREIEQEIADVRADYTDRIANSPDEAEAWQSEMNLLLADLQNEYETAPDEPVSVASDGRLNSVAEKYAENPGDPYWKWEHDLNADGQVMMVMTKDRSANFYVQNNANYSNKIEFTTSQVGPQSTNGVVVGIDPTEYDIRDFSPADREQLPPNLYTHGYMMQGESLKQVEGDSCTLSQEDAEQKAQDFMKTVGIKDFALSEGDKYSEILIKSGTEAKNTEYYYRTCYILRFCRMINGVMLRQDSGMKEDFGDNNQAFTKRLWPQEVIEFTIDDNGIVGFKWCAPLDITETVVDSAAMKPFSDIRATFEKMLPIANTSEHGPVRIDIDKIQLSYSRISERDSFDTGLVVPVWGFLGNYTLGTSDSMTADEAKNQGLDPNAFYDLHTTYGSQLSINAIDGSVIDGALGY